MNLDIIPTFRGKFLVLCVPVPRDYPNTPFATYCRNEKDGCFATLSISLDRIERIDRLFCNEKRYLPWNVNEYEDPSVLFLHAFYVHSGGFSDGAKMASLSEKTMLRGMGKRMLCTGLVLMVQKHGLDPNSTFIIAEADGGNVTDPEMQAMMNRDEKDLIYELFTDFPSELMKNIRYMENKQDIAWRLGSAKANMKLIDYYRKTYGFELWQPSPSTGALIGAHVIDMIQKCQR